MRVQNSTDSRVVYQPDYRSRRDHVAQALKDMILNGDWRPGDLLPSQAKLAEMFSVSMTVVREAIHSLQGQGLVKVLHGKGTVVVPVTASYALEVLRLLAERKMMTIWNLWEVRYLLEPGTAALAAERASPEQLQALEQILAPTLQPGVDSRTVIQAEMPFHRTLAEATGNPLLPLIMEVFAALFIESFTVTMPTSGPPASPEHLAILEAVRARDPERAREAMRIHLIRTKERSLDRDSVAGTGPAKQGASDDAEVP